MSRRIRASVFFSSDFYDTFFQEIAVHLFALLSILQMFSSNSLTLKLRNGASTPLNFQANIVRNFTYPNSSKQNVYTGFQDF